MKVAPFTDVGTLASASPSRPPPLWLYLALTGVDPHLDWRRERRASRRFAPRWGHSPNDPPTASWVLTSTLGRWAYNYPPRGNLFPDEETLHITIPSLHRPTPVDKSALRPVSPSPPFGDEFAPSRAGILDGSFPAALP
ncbi:Xyloglucan endotransglucosylase/hydrolase [Psidium guajava]|nr:Xyloglucan endotransglucosylase/hydrolase [Psidium guajava]